MFIFGDFNLRLDGNKLVAFLEKKFSTKVDVGKKQVKAAAEVMDFFNNCERHLDQLRAFDLEGVEAMETAAQSTGVELAEFERNFRPTYPYAVPVTTERDNSGGDDPTSRDDSQTVRKYNTARLPAWCDRVLFNPAALKLMIEPSKKAIAESLHKKREGIVASGYQYSSVVLSEMDHEAVYLAVSFPQL